MRILPLLFLLTLAGCTGNQKFDCPIVGGVSCLRLSEVDRKVDQGELGYQPQDKLPEKPSQVIAVNFDDSKQANAPQRIPEAVLRVWLAPYQTKDGVYHQHSFLHVVVRKAQWLPPVVDVFSGD